MAKVLSSETLPTVAPKDRRGTGIGDYSQWLDRGEIRLPRRQQPVPVLTNPDGAYESWAQHQRQQNLAKVPKSGHRSWVVNSYLGGVIRVSKNE